MRKLLALAVMGLSFSVSGFAMDGADMQSCGHTGYINDELCTDKQLTDSCNVLKGDGLVCLIGADGNMSVTGAPQVCKTDAMKSEMTCTMPSAANICTARKYSDSTYQCPEMASSVEALSKRQETLPNRE